MEAQDNDYRKAMVYMKKFRPLKQAPEICMHCVGWKHFGGLEAKDVTMGPMCICDENWRVVHKYISIMKRKKLLAI